jgi:hypothetical protein
MAICLVGLVGALKSLLEGFEIDEMKRLSFCSVGFLKGCIWRFLSLDMPLSSFVLLSKERSSEKSSVCRMTVHPAGKMLW